MSNPIYGNVVGGGGSSSVIKTITEPCHIAELEPGIYIVKNETLGEYHGKVIISNKENSTTINDNYFYLDHGFLTVLENFITDDGGMKQSLLGFTAQGLFRMPNVSHTNDFTSQYTIQGEYANSLSGCFLLSQYSTEDEKWYSELPMGVESDIPVSAIINEITSESTDFQIPSASAVKKYMVNNGAIKTITKPTHIADLDIGTYVVNGNMLDFDGELGRIIIQNVAPDGTIDNEYFILFNGIISITQKDIVNEDDTEERIAISFTASGNMNTPEGINVAETTGEDGSIVMVETIATTSFSSSVSYIIMEYVKPKVDNPDKGYIAGQWYNEDLFLSTGDISCEALTENITPESTRFEVPTAKSVYEYINTNVTDVIAQKSQVQIITWEADD